MKIKFDDIDEIWIDTSSDDTEGHITTIVMKTGIPLVIPHQAHMALIITHELIDKDNGNDARVSYLNIEPQ